MTTHISDELPRLLSGEATRDVVQEAAAHLRGCEDCQQELVSALVAHASLTSARRFAPDVVTRPAEPPADAGAPPAPLPDLSAVFAQVREEAASSPEPASRRRPLLVAAAVAAGILVGSAGAVLVQHGGGGASARQSVALTAFDRGAASASAEAKIIGKDHMKLDAAALPALDAKHRYEVWLTNAARTQMQPVGWIGADGTAELTVPPDLMSSYSDIEVSVQQVDAPTYDYSGTSVLRGSYA